MENDVHDLLLGFISIWNSWGDYHQPNGSSTDCWAYFVGVATSELQIWHLTPCKCILIMIPNSSFLLPLYHKRSNCNAQGKLPSFEQVNIWRVMPKLSSRCIWIQIEKFENLFVSFLSVHVYERGDARYTKSLVLLTWCNALCDILLRKYMLIWDWTLSLFPGI